MGFRGARSLWQNLSKDREEEDYPQNLPSGRRGNTSSSLLGIPSIGSLTGA
jgi:hypothetical protein